jgi:uncharacterized membrane protein YgcG
MKLQALSFVSLLGLVAGCTGGVVGNGTGSSESTADLKLGNASVAKRRTHRPLKTPLERITRPTMKSALGGAPAPLPEAATSAPQPALTYRGGPVLQSTQVYAVFWGPNVDATVKAGLPGFYAGVTASASPINSMLSQYNTNGMTIGTASFMSSIADDDAPIPSDGIITDTMIEAEGARLVDTGVVPAENGHNILMFHFPAGVKIDQGGGTMSCEVFCAYHSAFTRNGNNFFYGVIPSQNTDGCDQGCGDPTKLLDTTYSTSSHELIEAITDGAVGVNDLAWYDDTWGEIGDVCIEWDGTSNNYHVQSEWSNADHGCVDHSATTNATIDVKFDNTVTTAAGSNATFSITSSGNAGGTLTLAEMSGLGGTFSPATPNLGSGATLSLPIPAGTRSQDVSFKLAATDANGTHHFAPAMVHIKGAAPTITSITPATGPSQGNTAITITGTNFGPGAQAFICAQTGCTTAALQKPVNGGYVNGSGGTKFQLIAPSHQSGTNGAVNITIVNLNDTTQAKVAYTYTTGVSPTVTAVSPAQGPIAGNTFVTITGTDFSSNATMTIAGVKMVAGQNYLVQDDKTIIALTPAVSAAGPQTIQVNNLDGRSGKLTNGFNYGPNPPPSIDALSVDNGPTAGGTYVTVFGENLDDNATVSFDGIAAPVKSSNPSFLGVFSPAHAAGAVDLVVTNADGLTTKTTYTYADGSGGSGGGGGGGTGGSGGGGGGNGVGGNHIDPNSGGCSMGGASDSAASIISLLLVFGALAFAMRRQRS